MSFRILLPVPVCLIVFQLFSGVAAAQSGIQAGTGITAPSIGSYGYGASVTGTASLVNYYNSGLVAEYVFADLVATSPTGKTKTISQTNLTTVVPGGSKNFNLGGTLVLTERGTWTVETTIFLQ